MIGKKCFRIFALYFISSCRLNPVTRINLILEYYDEKSYYTGYSYYEIIKFYESEILNN